MKKRVLVIDDEVMLTKLIGGVLAHHSVTLATSGRQALDLISKEEPFDLILCDLMMPDLTGMDLYDAASCASPGLEKKMVFMTGGAFTARAGAFLDRLAEAGNTCVAKPFKIDELVALVDDRLSRTSS